MIEVTEFAKGMLFGVVFMWFAMVIALWAWLKWSD